MSSEEIVIISRKCVFAALVIVVFAATGSFCAEQPILQVRVSIDDDAAVRALYARGFDVVWVQEDFVELLTDAGGFGRLRSEGYSVEVVHEDVEEYYASRLLTAAPEPFGGYKTLSQIYDYLDAMILSHPDIVTDRISIGQTIEGRDIYAVKISDNPDVDEDEPELSFNSLTHAREVITPEVLLYFMDHLTDNYGIDPDITDIVDNREIWFVLVVNPDGYYYNELSKPSGGGMWRKNRRDNPDGSYGVDLNRNFGYAWGYDDIGSSPVPDDETYRGTAAFSEPETQVMRDFEAAHNFVLEVAYHSYSDYILFPWRYDCYDTPDDDLFWVLADSMSSYNGYTPVPPSMYSTNGGFNDWSYGEQTIKDKTMSFCLEVGDYYDGFWPELDDVDALVAENLGMNLFLCRAAGDVYSLAPPLRPEVHVPDGIQSPDYTVSWGHDDPTNPAVEYELVELRGPATFTDYCNDFDNWDGEDPEINSNLFYSSPSSIELASKNNYIETREPVYITAGDIMECQLYYDLVDGYGYVYVEISDDAFNFESLPGNITTNENPLGYNTGNGITGVSDGWASAQFDLSAYEGQSLWIRFSFRPIVQDGSSYIYDYVMLDDIRILKSFISQTVIASDLTDTMYNFTDKTNQDYFYRVRALDAQNQWSALSTYEVVTVSDDGCCMVKGDYNHSGSFDIQDINDFIDWLLRQPAEPAECEEEADVTGATAGVPDGSLDIRDIEYMIGYLFRGTCPALPDCP